MKKLITFLFSMFCIFIASTPVFAYTVNSYDLDSASFHYDKLHFSGDNTVTVFYLPQPVFKETDQLHYEFFCKEAMFDDVMQCNDFSYDFRLSIDDKISEIVAGNIYSTSFTLEDGIYEFAGYGDSHPLGFDFVSFDDDKDYKAFQTMQTVELQNKSQIRVYVILGEYEWAKEHYEEFRKWAIKKEKQLNPNFTEPMLEQTEENIEQILQKQTATVETVTSETPEEIQYETVPEENITMQTIPVETEKPTTTNTTPIIFIIGFILLGIVVGVFIKKRF